MQELIKNLVVTGLLSACVLTFTQLIEARYLGGLVSPIGEWIVPPFVGAIASVALRGPLWGRAIYCFSIYPIALFIMRTFLMTPPKDAGSDAFLLACTVGLAVYSTLGLLIGWFGAQYFSTRKRSGQVRI